MRRLDVLRFPSPIGELHFSMRFSNTTKRRTNLFPSPIGELHFSIVLFATLGIFLWIVSVPYRGATFLNIYPILSSVFIFEFPSPIGELHFSIVYLWKLEMEWKWCFRPLSGSYISQSCFFISLSYSSLVSVPYRGATFLNTLPDLTIHLVSFPSPIGELHFSMIIESLK